MNPNRYDLWDVHQAAGQVQAVARNGQVAISDAVKRIPVYQLTQPVLQPDTSLTKKSIGFPDHPKLKSALGISSRSLVHRAGRAGGFGQNPGYATRIGAVAKASQYVKYGGWIGTAVGGGASYMKVQDVCTAGNTEACEKVKYTEGGGFIGGFAGGVASGVFLGAGTTGAICVALGVATAGVGMLVCGIVVVGGGSLAVGLALGKIGEKTGEIIYEVTQ